MAATTTKKVEVGDKAPEFTLQTTGGESVSLSSIVSKNKAVVMYFYPKDETPGCTAEACSFRDSYQAFKDAGAEVVGISSDSVEKHKAFTEHHKLPFILLSDPDSAVRKQYGVEGSMFGLLPGRVTYVIDNTGVVRLVFSSQLKPKQHIAEALKVISTFTPK